MEELLEIVISNGGFVNLDNLNSEKKSYPPGSSLLVCAMTYAPPLLSQPISPHKRPLPRQTWQRARTGAHALQQLRHIKDPLPHGQYIPVNPPTDIPSITISASNFKNGPQSTATTHLHR
jgi:hypothetical protein